jgi:hypothetical protein
MSFPRLSRGLDVADFVELSAPTPWLIQATEQDYFTPEGAKLVYEEARHWYGLYGAEDKVKLFVGSGPHGTPLASREAIYEWMIHWLKDGRGDSREQPVKLYTNHQLLVTHSGHVEDEPGSRKLYQIVLEEFRRRRKQGTVSELMTELRRLQIPSDGTSPAVNVLEESSTTAGRRRRIRFESEPGVLIEGTLHIPPTPGQKAAVLLVTDDSSSSFAASLVKAGQVVLELQPRDSPGDSDRRPFVGNWITNARALQIGRNLPAMRAHDLLRAVDVLASSGEVAPKSIRAAARGVKGIWLLLAAAVDTRISKVWLDRTPHSLQSALERSINTDLFDAVVPGFVLHWDLQDLIRAMGDRPVLWTDPTNWMRRTVFLGPPYQYRYVLGDTTDLAEEQNNAFIGEFLR